MTDLLAWAIGWLCASQLSTHHTGKHQPNLAHAWGSEGSVGLEAGLLQTTPRENANQMNGCDLVKSAEPTSIFIHELQTMHNTIYANIYKLEPNY